MKYAIFIAFTLLAVPAMTFAAMSSSRMRGWLFTLMLFSTALGAHASINFFDSEQLYNIFYRGPDRGFEVTFTDMISLSLMLAMFMKFPTKVQWLPYNALWMGAFFLLACVSTAGAPRPIYGGYTLWKLVRVYGLYWCVVNCLRTGVSLNSLRVALVSIGLYVFYMALWQKYRMHLYRVNGPFDHSNTIPLYINMMMPMTLLFALCDRSLKPGARWLTVFTVLGMIFCVLATQSRAGLILSGGTFIAGMVYANIRARSGSTTAISVAALVCMIIGGAIAAPTIIKRFKEAPASSELARHEFNIAADMMAHDHSLGVGLNNFTHVLTYTDKYRAHIQVMANEEQAGVAHHLYKLLAAEMGYPGLGLFLLILLRFFWRAIRTVWKRKDLPAGLAFGLFLGWSAVFAGSLLEWCFRVTPVTQDFTICAAVAVALSEMPLPGKTIKSVKSEPAGPDRPVAKAQPAGA